MNPSRRNFLQKMALGTGTVLLPGRPKPIFPEPKKLGVALVGLGNYATNQLAPALQETQLCRLAGIVTGTPEKAAKWSQQHNLPPQNVYN